MAEENTPEVEETIVDDAEQEAADDAAFEAGFHEVREDDTEAPEQAAAEPEQKEESTVKEEPTEAPVLAGLTESEIGELLGKVRRIDELQQGIAGLKDKAFGKIGELSRNIQALQKSGVNTGKLQVQADKLKRLHEMDPEYAEALADDLNNLIPVGTQAENAVTGDYVNNVVNDAVQKVSQTYEEKILTMAHPDHNQVTQTPEFGSWLGLKSAQEQQQIMNSRDAIFVSNQLNEFKQWRDQAQQQQQTQAEQQAQQQKKQDRLARAVVPEGLAQEQMGVSDEDAFLAGFKEARGI